MMQIVLGGRLESSIIRAFDAIQNLDRNKTPNEYYLNLNRKTALSFFHRASTYITLANATIIPSADWNSGRYEAASGICAEDVGVSNNFSDDLNEFNHVSQKIANYIIGSRAIKRKCLDIISDFDKANFGDERLSKQQIVQIRERQAYGFIWRLLSQIFCAQRFGAFLVLADEDLQIAKDIIDILVVKKLHSFIDLPALDGQIIEPDSFSNGLLSFCPPDVQSLLAVRNDDDIKQYSEQVRAHISSSTIVEGERALLRAMVLHNQKSDKSKKISSVIEFSSWMAKPISYIPVAGNIMNMANDTKDVLQKWREKIR